MILLKLQSIVFAKIVVAQAQRDSSLFTVNLNMHTSNKRVAWFLNLIRENHPKWRANATTAFLSFHKSEIGIPFPSKSKTFTNSSELDVSSLSTGDSIPGHIHTLKQLLALKKASVQQRFHFHYYTEIKRCIEWICKEKESKIG